MSSFCWKWFLLNSYSLNKQQRGNTQWQRSAVEQAISNGNTYDIPILMTFRTWPRKCGGRRTSSSPSRCCLARGTVCSRRAWSTCWALSSSSAWDGSWYKHPCSLTVVSILTYYSICNWPIDSPPFCPGLHDLRIDCLNTYYNIKAISLHYTITDQLSD